VQHLGAAVDLLVAVRDRDRVEFAARTVAAQDAARILQVIAEPVSSCVRKSSARPRQSPRLVTKVADAAPPLASPGYQFWMVEYLISASSRRDQLDHRGA
jgi:hypothetical protein